MLRGEPGTQVCLLVWSGDVDSECEVDALVVSGVAARPAGRVDARGDPDRRAAGGGPPLVSLATVSRTRPETCHAHVPQVRLPDV